MDGSDHEIIGQKFDKLIWQNNEIIRLLKQIDASINMVN